MKLPSSSTKKLFALSLAMNLLLILNQLPFFELDLISLIKLAQLSRSPKRLPCIDKRPTPSYSPRGERYYVLHNYIIAERSFHCDESITYTTHGEWTYLDKLIPLLHRWNGPVSMSVYCPGKDFEMSLRKIQYLRECTSLSKIMKEFVTFHMIFDHDPFPEIVVPSTPSIIEGNCQELRNELQSRSISSERQQNSKMTYPINTLRNVARENALTYFVLPSDIELFPSPNLISRFLKMIAREKHHLENINRKLFVLPIFEVEENVTVTRLPETKEELVKLLEANQAVTFHEYTCRVCHEIPRAQEWRNTREKGELGVFHVARREGKYKNWEPIYIATNDQPWYDERLSWEGRRDKMTQAFIFCLLNYEFHILDNAFLLHSPGIKRKSDVANEAIHNQYRLILHKIVPELELLYGNGTKNHGCES